MVVCLVLGSSNYLTSWMLVVQNSESIESIVLPAPRVADFAVGVVQYSTPMEVSLPVELSLIHCPVAELLLPVRVV